MTRGRSEGDGGEEGEGEDEVEESTLYDFIDNYWIRASNSRSEVLPLKSKL